MNSSVILSLSVSRGASWLGARYDGLHSLDIFLVQVATLWCLDRVDDNGGGSGQSFCARDHDKMFFFDPS